ncbi:MULTISPECIES: DUF6783 domain-containing protein [Robinsoniella]|uniref:DUF6783 domain-containing protein n=1 Tax=Robinsoniella TaxID=588605 RepID=UPI00290E5006|nr:DUF6783 domain-containing protein [Clostridiales bacterium]
MKIHISHLHAPLRMEFAPKIVSVDPYASCFQNKFPTKCDTQLPESNFKTHSGTLNM